MAPEERTERLALRLTKGEAAMVGALAEDLGVSLSDAVRIAVRDAYRAKFGDIRQPASVGPGTLARIMRESAAKKPPKK